jgi:hypothetical protein
MPRPRKLGRPKRRGRPRGSRKWTIETFAELEEELENALQIEESAKSLNDIRLRLTAKISVKQRAEILSEAKFTKNVGNLSIDHLRQLLAEMRECRRKNEIRFNMAKLKFVFEDDKS